MRITVTPPTGVSGIAEMLVALGIARVSVSHAEAMSADSGAYRLTVDQPAAALQALRQLGCRTYSEPWG